MLTELLLKIPVQIQPFRTSKIKTYHKNDVTLLSSDF